MLAKIYTRVLREAQSKSKQKEYGIPRDKFPKYPHDTDDLDYYCINALVQCARSFYKEETLDQEELSLCNNYFDSAINIEKQNDHTNEYLIFGACANFLSSNFGNVKVYMSLLKEDIPVFCYNLVYFLSASTGVSIKKIGIDIEKADLRKNINNYLLNGKDYELIDAKVLRNIKDGFESFNVSQTIFNTLLISVLKYSKSYLSVFSLEEYSGVEYGRWVSFFKNNKLPRMLWQAQIEIGKQGGYKGNSLVIQTPTGSGKTKSIQLIVASHYFHNGNKIKAIILSPLRSLCDEISNDLTNSISQVEVVRLSDVIEEDDRLNPKKDFILILTPEKFEYILFHDKSFVDNVDLLIIDEGHLIEDNTRGTSFELIISELKSLGFAKPIIFISAILNNPQQIGDWLFDGDEYSLVQKSSISTTNKNISKTSANKVDFYDKADLKSPIYYVANPVVVKKLKKFPRERKERLFPNQTTEDISIYYMFLFSKNGGVGVFFKSIRSLRKYLTRALEVTDRGYEIKSINNEHIGKLKNLIEKHYGKSSPYLKSVDIGLGFHYSTLEEGIKKSIEHYLRRKYIDKVFCTATLSEGVNIPIKYLIITDLNEFTYDLKTREIINLVGRTARNGEYSEGTILVTADCEKDKFEKLFDESGIEPLKSSLNIIIEDKLMLSYSIVVKDFFELIMGYLKESDCMFADFFGYVVPGFNDYCEKKHKNESVAWAKRQLEKYCIQATNCINSLKVYISNYISSHQEETFDDFFHDIIEKTYLYSISDDNKKGKFNEICSFIYQKSSEKIAKSNTRYVKYPFASIDTADLLIEWNEQNKEFFVSDIDGYLLALIELFDGVYKSNVPIEKFKQVFAMWIRGKTFIEISEQCGLDIYVVEKVCRDVFSFRISNLVGNLIDIIGDEDSELLKIYQKRIKYGLNSETAIKIYELGICDRYLAGLYEEYGLTQTEEILKDYPELFAEKFESIKNKL